MPQNIADKTDAVEVRTKETRGFMQQVRVVARRRYTLEEKVHIVLEGFRWEVAVRDLCRREGIKPGAFYAWTKDFMEAGKERLTRDAVRDATCPITAGAAHTGGGDFNLSQWGKRQTPWHPSFPWQSPPAFPRLTPSLQSVIIREHLLKVRFQKYLTTEQTTGCLISCTYDLPSGEEAVNIIPGRC